MSNNHHRAEKRSNAKKSSGIRTIEAGPSSVSSILGSHWLVQLVALPTFPSFSREVTSTLPRRALRQ